MPTPPVLSNLLTRPAAFCPLELPFRPDSPRLGSSRGCDLRKDAVGNAARQASRPLCRGGGRHKPPTDPNSRADEIQEPLSSSITSRLAIAGVLPQPHVVKLQRGRAALRTFSSCRPPPREAFTWPKASRFSPRRVRRVHGVIRDPATDPSKSADMGLARLPMRSGHQCPLTAKSCKAASRDPEMQNGTELSYGWPFGGRRNEVVTALESFIVHVEISPVPEAPLQRRRCVSETDSEASTHSRTAPPADA